jgi:hypothetical protein
MEQNYSENESNHNANTQQPPFFYTKSILAREPFGSLARSRRCAKAKTQSARLKPQDPKPVSRASSRLRKLLKHYYAYHTFGNINAEKRKTVN